MRTHIYIPELTWGCNSGRRMWASSKGRWPSRVGASWPTQVSNEVTMVSSSGTLTSSDKSSRSISSTGSSRNSWLPTTSKKCSWGRSNQNTTNHYSFVVDFNKRMHKTNKCDIITKATQGVLKITDHKKHHTVRVHINCSLMLFSIRSTRSCTFDKCKTKKHTRLMYMRERRKRCAAYVTKRMISPFYWVNKLVISAAQCVNNCGWEWIEDRRGEVCP